MDESKIELTHRLEREGRWSEASLWKDQHIASLRGEGMPRKEAQQAAWEALEKRFPPVESEEESSPLEAFPEGLADLPDSSTEDFVKDALWVYSRLGMANVKPSDAPSPGAWSLLRWAKRNEDRFFEVIMPKVMAAKNRIKEAEEEETLDDLSELEGMLKDHNHGFWRQIQIEKDISADEAGVVKSRVSGVVEEWLKTCQPDLSEEDLAGLSLRMEQVVKDFWTMALAKPDLFETVASHEA